MTTLPSSSHPPRELALGCHAATPCAAACAITVGVGCSDARLRLRYRLSGELAALRVAPAGAPRRGHDLWLHTCFEAFLAAAGADHYYELNFSPSREWAAYRLSAYRQGLTPVAAAEPARVAVERDAAGLTLEAEIDLAPLTDFGGAAPVRLALSAVIEDAQQRLSYWALAHPAPAPDFHHPDGFVLELPGACAQGPT